MIVQSYIHGAARIKILPRKEVNETGCARFWRTCVRIVDKHGNVYELILLSDYDAPPELDVAGPASDQ